MTLECGAWQLTSGEAAISWWQLATTVASSYWNHPAMELPQATLAPIHSYNAQQLLTMAAALVQHLEAILALKQPEKRNTPVDYSDA